MINSILIIYNIINKMMYTIKKEKRLIKLEKVYKAKKYFKFLSKRTDLINV